MDANRATTGDTRLLRDTVWSPASTGASLQVVSRSALYDRLGDWIWQHPEQLQFNMVICCDAGTGTHMVDFETVKLGPNGVLHVRPGQIHQWQPEATYEARLILIREFRHQPDDLGSAGPAVQTLTGQQKTLLDTICTLHSDLSAALSETASDQLANDAIRDLLQATLGVAGAEPLDRQHRGGAYFDLRADIEKHLTHRETIQTRARRLGYSTKTLDRSSREATGKTAKRVADERLALEARRLLALPDSRTTSVARKLGFAEATNFAKFVKRMTGELPSAWQQRTTTSDA